MARHRCATWLGMAVLGVLTLAGCSGSGGGGGGGGGTAPATRHPLDVVGQDCLACHEPETWDFVALHDRNAPDYDSDCIKCHGTMLDEVTLDPQRPGPHAQMLPLFFAEGQVEPTNVNCTHCHSRTDLLQESGADIRRQVYVTWCWGCHREGGLYEPVLYPN